MKNGFFIFVFALIVKGALFAEGNSGNPVKESNKPATHLITGKVIDRVSGEEITGAEIKIGEKTILTDLNGNFVASVPAQKTTLVASFVSYSNTEVIVEPFSNTGILIQLESK